MLATCRSIELEGLPCNCHVPCMAAGQSFEIKVTAVPVQQLRDVRSMSSINNSCDATVFIESRNFEGDVTSRAC